MKSNQSITVEECNRIQAAFVAFDAASETREALNKLGNEMQRLPTSYLVTGPTGTWGVTHKGAPMTAYKLTLAEAHGLAKRIGFIQTEIAYRVLPGGGGEWFTCPQL